MRDIVKKVSDIYEIRDVSLDFTGTISLTHQSEKDKCDINLIVQRANDTGLVSHINPRTAQYLDTTTINDFQAMQNMVIAGQNEFNSLPAQIRAQFGNDAMVFFEAVAENPDILVDLGLAEKSVDPVNEKSVDPVNEKPENPVKTSGETKTPPAEQ